MYIGIDESIPQEDAARQLKTSAPLRAAQIEMLQDATWKSPYYLAAFTLQGEWR